MKAFERKFPTLAALIAAGVVKEEDGAYIGRAEDDVWVQVGNVDDPARTEGYLRVCPTPNHW